MSKVWRLIFTIVATVPVVMLGWFAADSALRFFAVDQELGPVFTPLWVKIVYRLTYLIAGIVLGVALGRAIFRQLELMGDRLQKMSVRDKVAIGGGLVIGITLSAIVSLPVIFTVGTTSKLMAVALTLFIAVLVTYLCTIAALSMKEELHFYMPSPAEEEKLPDERFKILDTNVIIDGRIADIAKAGFVEGHLYVPGFVLEELQHIADSADGLKRARGRRGLDILRTMQVEQELTVRRYDKLAPPGEPVDTRLVRLAKALNGAIVTNDYNLNKVAQLEGVPILNVNELANALKSVVLPGEQMHVTVVKKGREPGQGVGFLDDGTMVVVEGGLRRLGDTVPIAVSSVLQTTAGKMIFAHIDDDGSPPPPVAPRRGNGGSGAGGPNGTATVPPAAALAEDEETGDDADTFLDNVVNGNGEGGNSHERNVRSYTGRRPRRPVR